MAVCVSTTVTLNLEVDYPVPPVGGCMLYNDYVYKILACDCEEFELGDCLFEYQLVTALELGQYYEGVTLAQIDYFKNSVMRNPDGTLNVYYHGTDRDFDQFSPACIVSEPGFWFAGGQYFSAQYGDKLLKVYLNITKPFVLDDPEAPEYVRHYAAFLKGEKLGRRGVHTYAFRDYLISQGYDGLLHYDNGCHVAIAFHPSQIKAINNWYPVNSPLIYDAKIERYKYLKNKF